MLAYLSNDQYINLTHQSKREAKKQIRAEPMK